MSANQITVFLDPAQLPSRTQEQEPFDDAMGQFMQNLPVFGAQFNAAIAQFNAALAGGAYAMAYTVDLSSTANADPGVGKLRFNSATQSSSTSLFVDLTAGGLDVTSLLDMFDASTSSVKGSIRLVKMGDLTKWLTFDVTARITATGYRNLSVVNTAGSSPNPFAVGESVLLFFQRTGDKGADGFTSYMKVSERYGSGTSAPLLNVGQNTRVLNTVEWNDISGATLASSIITLPAGTYEVSARAPGYLCGQSQAWLKNMTDSTIQLVGSSAYSYTSNSAASDSFVTGRFTIAASKTFSLIHYASGGRGGNFVGNGLAVEVFAEVVIKKVS